MMKHKARKRFGQNFLQDQHIIYALLNLVRPQKGDNFLEIGPGLGALTLPLLKEVQTLTAVEIDRDLCAHLQAIPLCQQGLTLISQDALTVDYSQFGDNLRLIGNLPYNISTPLLLHLLAYLPFIKDMYFMLQKEVVDRLAAPPGSRDYGRLGIMLQYHCQVEEVLFVPPQAFEPAPKVDSAIVRLIPHQDSPYEKIESSALAELTARAFGMRRKTLANNLKGLISAAELSALGINPQDRPEQIPIQDFIKIGKFLSK